MRLSPRFPRLHCVKYAPFAIVFLFLLTNFTGVLFGRAFAPNTDVTQFETLDALTSGDSDLDQLIAKIGETEGVDPRFIHAVIWQESKYEQHARSHVGAQGLMQLMPATARRFGCKNANDPAENIAAGTKYLSWLLKRFDGNVELALAGYNAGEGSVDKYNGIPPYVTCVPPSGREIVPSLLALTPLPAVAELTPAGRSTGGHVVAHESVHMIVPPLSDANAYSVNPLESTSTVPTPGIDFVPMMTEPACVVVELPPPELGAAFLAQADNAISVATDAIQTGRLVLVDDFTFVLLRAGGLESGRPSSRVFATANSVGC